MNETKYKNTLTEPLRPETQTPADEPEARTRATDSTGMVGTGSFARGEETQPARNAEERVLHRGTFASGLEERLEENAERRLYARGGFAVGVEANPDADAEARRHPGTYADTELPDADTHAPL